MLVVENSTSKLSHFMDLNWIFKGDSTLVERPTSSDKRSVGKNVKYFVASNFMHLMVLKSYLSPKLLSIVVSTFNLSSEFLSPILFSLK